MKKLFYILIMCIAHEIFAQNEPYTLTWCLEQGLQNNFSIQIADKRLETAGENASLTNAGLLPSLNATASYGGNLTSARYNSRATGVTSSDIGYLDKTLSTQVGLTWTVWDGGALKARYHELGILREQSSLSRRVAAEELISDITAEYYNVIQQRIRLRNYRNAMLLSRERMRIVEERYNIGNFSRLDYMQAKVDFNADSAQYMKQQEAYRSSQIQLNKLLNTGEELNKRVRLADTVIAVAPVLDYEGMWENALTSNTELQDSRLKARLSEEAIKKAEARKYPTVRVNAGYGYNRYDYEIAANKWSDRWGPSASVSMSLDIFDGSRRAARHAAKRDYEIGGMLHRDLELSLEARFKTLRQSHENYLQILHLEEMNLATAQENYEIARERYLLGDLSGFEMREAQQSLLRAEERILTAAYNTKMCEISLLLISGGIETYLSVK